MRATITLMTLALTLLRFDIAIAQLYQCKVNGKIIFTNQPCPENSIKSELNLHLSPRDMALKFCEDKWTYSNDLKNSCIEKQLKAKKYLDSLVSEKDIELKELCRNRHNENYVETQQCITTETTDIERAQIIDSMEKRKLMHEKAKKELLKEREKQWLETRKKALAIAPQKGLYVVEYIVEGTTESASLTFINQTGGTEQHDEYLPWRNVLIVDKNFHAYISAQKQSEYGSIKTKILLNGHAIKESESSSPYGIASSHL